MTVRAAIAANYLRKAERALDEAKLIMTANKTEGASNRAYYAMYDAAHAALFAVGRELPDALIKTHHTLIGEFGKSLVLSGHIDAHFGRAFNRAHDIRLLADYNAEPPSIEDAKWLVEQADALLAAIKKKFSL
jgi:uncharacterized protein (UPF0332 family)